MVNFQVASWSKSREITPRVTEMFSPPTGKPMHLGSTPRLVTGKSVRNGWLGAGPYDYGNHHFFNHLGKYGNIWEDDLYIKSMNIVQIHWGKYSQSAASFRLTNCRWVCCRPPLFCFLNAKMCKDAYYDHGLLRGKRYLRVTTQAHHATDIAEFGYYHVSTGIHSKKCHNQYIHYSYNML